MSVSTETVPGPTNVKKHFCFRPSTDVILLCQVHADRPFEKNPGRTVADCWNIVATTLNHTLGFDNEDSQYHQLSGDTCYRRFRELTTKYKSENMEKLKSSGTVEEYEEREQLLEDLVS